MLEYGSVTGLPGKYRITLAISIALLIHTLVMSALPFTIPEAENHRRTVQVELVNPGSQPSPETTPSAASHTRNDQPPQATVDKDNSKPTSRPDVVALDAPGAPDSAPEETAEPSAREQAAEPAENSAPSRASTASAAGTPEATTETEPEPVTQITRSPQETDPYMARLAAHVGKELDNHPVPSSRLVKEPVKMELELRLLGSGALTAAKIIQSTGFSDIDTAVYKAALLASPYPQPPDEYSGRKRFRVELIFTPERL
jgi:protein TonB